MTRRLLTSIVASAVLIAGAVIGLRYMQPGPGRHATGQVTASIQTERDNAGRKVAQEETGRAQEERKLAEARRQADQAQQREADQLGMIMALRHEEQRAPADPQRQSEPERQAQEPGQPPVVLKQQASPHPEQKIAAAPGQAEPPQAVQGEERKVADTHQHHAPRGARAKPARRAQCATPPCRPKAAAKRRAAAASGQRTMHRHHRTRHAAPGLFGCPVLARLEAALAELLAPPARPTAHRRIAHAHHHNAVVVR